MRRVVITGASTGIGLESCRVCVRHGFHVYGTVRRAVDAERVRAELGERFEPVLCDVTDAEQVRAAVAKVDAALAGETLAGVVNNAGVVVPGPLEQLDVAAFREQIEINLVAPLVVTQAFLPLLGTDAGRHGEPGRIVNISSVAGRLAAPFMGAYVASKHALEGLSVSWRRELWVHGIDVIVIGPGSVVTPIWDKAERADYAPYRDTVYGRPLERFSELAIRRGRRGLAPERVALVVLQALTARRPKARYAPVINPLINWHLPRLLPQRFGDQLFARVIGLPRRPGRVGSAGGVKKPR